MINEQMEQKIQELVELNALIFNSKEEYLTWRYAWKEKYKYLSVLSRKAKNARKTKYYNEDLSFTDKETEYIKKNISKYYYEGSRWILWPIQNQIHNLICELYAAREIHRKRKECIDNEEKSGKLINN